MGLLAGDQFRVAGGAEFMFAGQVAVARADGKRGRDGDVGQAEASQRYGARKLGADFFIGGEAGYALGAVTAAIGPEAAMACTAAIETEIDRHYAEQREQLGDADPELSDTIADFQAEEVEHRDTALANGAEKAMAYPLLAGVIRLGCRAAIKLSARI